MLSWVAASIINYWFWFVITVTDENTYILTTDADVRFTHESVEALLDLMARDPTVGAVCGRTHPLGVGPIVWYQVFDYAIGHWFQKVHRNYMFSHTECIFVCHTTMQQHFIDNSINIIELESTKKA